MMKQPPNILTIAGSDSGAGAGIQGDLKSILALGGYGLSVITALTAQNGYEVTGIHAPDPDFVLLQLKAVRDGFPIAAAKTGMLCNAGIIHSLAKALQDKDFPLVIDPVAISQSNCKLLEDDAIEALITEFIPLADCITPNIPEAEMISGINISTSDDQIKAAEKILTLGPKAVLIKGGHMPDATEINDFLCEPNKEPLRIRKPFIQTNNTHGTGCALSAALATCLGRGMPLPEAAQRAEAFIARALSESYTPGKGWGPLNHAAGIRFS